MPRGDGTGPSGGSGRGGQGGAGGGAAGSGGQCVCPACGYREPHTVASPCNEQKCPKCGVPLIREK
jgi:uncharacterized protein